MVATAAVGAVGIPINAGLERGAPEPVAFASTNAVVAIWVVFVPTVAVGASGTPVKVGLTEVIYGTRALVIFCTLVPSVGLTPSATLVTELPPKSAAKFNEIGVGIAVILNKFDRLLVLNLLQAHCYYLYTGLSHK